MSITWDVFNVNQQQNSGKTVNLTNADFSAGTLRIKAPCTLLLTENIVFDPIRGADGPNQYYLPELSANASEYTPPNCSGYGYILGFFAAIAVEASDVTIDLNGFEIKQSKRHNMLQRFYAHIELANQPFMPNQGPSSFGDVMVSAKNCVVKNGRLGLTSHHGIHGNGAQGIKIKDVDFYDYEVCAVGLNGVNGLVMKNCNLLNCYQSIPTNGLFSAAVFIRTFAKRAIDTALSVEAKNDITEKLNALEGVIQMVLNACLPEDENQPHRRIEPTDPNYNLMEFCVNPTGLPDGGSNYAIIINALGVAVNSLLDHLPPVERCSKDVVFENVKISNFISDARETVALSFPPDNGVYKKIQTDTAGSVFQIKRVTDNNGLYSGNVLSDLQIALARWTSNEFGDTELIALKNDPTKKTCSFGTLNIHPAVVAWATDGLNYNGITSATTLSAMMEQNLFRFIYGGDVMFHVNKGTFGMRIEAVIGVKFDKVVISDVGNVGPFGSHDPSGWYIDKHDGGHLAQDTMVGYCGSDCIGVLCNSSKDIVFKKISVSDVLSENGTACGILTTYCDTTTEKKIKVSNVTTNAKQHDIYHYKNQCACGYKMVNVLNRDIKKRDLVVENITNTSFPQNVLTHGMVKITNPSRAVDGNEYKTFVNDLDKVVRVQDECPQGGCPQGGYQQGGCPQGGYQQGGCPFGH